MQLENMESKEKLIKDFFLWLFDDEKIYNRNIELDKEIDFSLVSVYKDPYIYYPNCFSKLLDTDPFKRLGRISQLSMVLETYPNAYNNRLEHSIGTYNRKLEEFLYNYENDQWRKSIENNHQKIYILADLIKMLGHDIGHLVFSHSMEIELFSSLDAHEKIGQRIMLENPEIQDVLIHISPELPNALKELYTKKILNFDEHDDGNYDVDRLDFLQRDSLYLGNESHIQHQKYETISTDKGKIDVYPFSSLAHIENFLDTRETYYTDAYCSIYTLIYESLLSYFVKAFLTTKSIQGEDLRRFLQNLRDNDTNQIDLNEFLKWDDISFYNRIIDIAQNHEDENIRTLAALTIPSLKPFLNLIYSHLQVYNNKPYSENDKDFLKKIRKIITGSTEFCKNVVLQLM